MSVPAPGGLSAALKRHPILSLVLVCFAAETGMNAIFGYRQAGGGFAGVIYGAIFVALAGLAAWTCVELFRVRGTGAVAWARRAAFALPFGACFAVSQVSGWGVVGVATADGGKQREVAATKGTVTSETLDAKRADRKAIGVTRAIGAIEADLDLELRKTSKTYPKGDGPKATRLRGELVTARRALALDGEIAAVVEKLDKMPAVAAGAPHVMVLSAIFEGGEKRDTFAADASLWWAVGLVAVLGFFANFGFALVLSGEPPAPTRPAPESEPWDWEHLPAVYRPHRTAALPAPQSTSVETRPAYAGAPAAVSHPVGHGGQPIHISLALAERTPSSATPPPVHVPSPTEARLLPAPEAAAPEAPIAPETPVDRSRTRELCDHLLVFRAACVIDEPAAVVSAETMYRRYRAWAGRRAVAAAAFHTMFPEVAGVALGDFGGVPHYGGVALRTEARLEAVGG